MHIHLREQFIIMYQARMRGTQHASDTTYVPYTVLAPARDCVHPETLPALAYMCAGILVSRITHVHHAERASHMRGQIDRVTAAQIATRSPTPGGSKKVCKLATLCAVVISFAKLQMCVIYAR